MANKAQQTQFQKGTNPRLWQIGLSKPSSRREQTQVGLNTPSSRREHTQGYCKSGSANPVPEGNKPKAMANQAEQTQFQKGTNPRLWQIGLSKPSSRREHTQGYCKSGLANPVPEGNKPKAMANQAQQTQFQKGTNPRLWQIGLSTPSSRREQTQVRLNTPSSRREQTQGNCKLGLANPVPEGNKPKAIANRAQQTQFQKGTNPRLWQIGLSKPSSRREQTQGYGKSGLAHPVPEGNTHKLGLTHPVPEGNKPKAITNRAQQTQFQKGTNPRLWQIGLSKPSYRREQTQGYGKSGLAHPFPEGNKPKVEAGTHHNPSDNKNTTTYKVRQINTAGDPDMQGC